MTEPQPLEPPPAEGAAPDTTSVFVRPWPKVVFLYPTMIAAVVCWLILLIGGDPLAPDATPAPAAPAAGVEPAQPAPATAPDSDLGNWFMLVFCLNLMVFSFDFSRIKSITIVIAIVGIGFALAWADTHWNVVGGLRGAFAKVDIQMNAQFYGWFAAFLFGCFLLVLINTRFNYFEVNHREVLHHHGYLGDITRIPTDGLRFNKEIYDLVEFALLRSGRLIFVTPTSHEAIVIDNVINVNRIEHRIKNLLALVAVRVA